MVEPAVPAGVFQGEIMAEHQVWERIGQFVEGTNVVVVVPAVGVVVEDVVVDAAVVALAEELLVLERQVIEIVEEGVYELPVVVDKVSPTSEQLLLVSCFEEPHCHPSAWPRSLV
jgi:hypothetical protein